MHHMEKGIKYGNSRNNKQFGHQYSLNRSYVQIFKILK